MSETDHDRLAQHEQQQKFYEGFVRPRLEDAKQIYSATIGAIWLGNSSGAIASLGFIGATWANGSFYKPALIPFGLFLLGVVLMGMGAIVTLFQEAKSINRMSRANSVLDLSLDDVRYPAQSIGLAFSETRTWAAAISAILFLGGASAGFLQLLTR